jgi:hypothetical protein
MYVSTGAKVPIAGVDGEVVGTVMLSSAVGTMPCALPAANAIVPE